MNISDNGKVGSGVNISEAVRPGRCPTGKQGGPGRQHTTASISGREGGTGKGGEGVNRQKGKTRKEGRRGKFKENRSDEERRVL